MITAPGTRFNGEEELPVAELSLRTVDRKRRGGREPSHTTAAWEHGAADQRSGSGYQIEEGNGRSEIGQAKR